MSKPKTDFKDFADTHPNYFPGQYLLDDDFEIQHKYLSDRQRYHQQGLHVSGIIEGLEVEVGQVGKIEVKIKPGSAIDNKGNLIILKDELTFGDFKTLTQGELFMQYSEILDPNSLQQKNSNANSYTRWLENPTVGFAATADVPANAVKLATITINGSTLTLDTGVRSYSGIFLPNPDGNDLTLRSEGATNSNLAVLNGSLKIIGNLDIQDNVTVNGNVGIGTSGPKAKLDVEGDAILQGNLSFGATTRQMINLWQGNYGIGVQASTQYFRTDKNFAWYKAGSHNNAELDAGTDGTIQMVINDGNVGIGTSDPIAKLDISTAPRTDTHPTAIKGLYITGDFKADSDGIEFRHSNGTQGIGFGYNTIYAAGTNGDQDLNLKPKGNGKVILTSLYDVYLRGSALESTEGNITFLKISNFDFGLTTQRGLNTIVLNPTGAYKLKKNHDVYDDDRNWNNWADWVNANASAGDIVAVASYDAIKNAPPVGSASTLLKSINAVQAFELVQTSERVPYTLFFVKGQSTSVEVSSPYQGSNAHLRTKSYLSQLVFSFGNNKDDEESWIDARFENDWVNYQNGYNPAAYFKDSLGVVHLRGMVRNGNQPLNTRPTIFTLPAYYRPQYRELHAVQTSPNIIGRVDILADGQVQIIAGNNQWISLDGITFRATG